MCHECQKQRERERAFWQTVRRALLMVAGAIQKRYDESEQNDRRAA